MRTMTGWTTSEVRRLREEYPEKGPSMFPERSKDSVKSQAQRQGVTFVKKCLSSNPIITRLYKERQEKNITLDTLEKFIGRSHSSISNWEKDIVSPRLRDLIDWLDFFDLELTVKKKLNPWEEK